jgi:hypothetical protein
MTLGTLYIILKRKAKWWINLRRAKQITQHQWVDQKVMVNFTNEVNPSKEAQKGPEGIVDHEM